MNYLFDIDGTLRNFETDPEIAPELHQILIDLKKKHQLFVVTGRTHNNYQIFLSEIHASSKLEAGTEDLFDHVYCEDGHLLYNSGQPQILIDTTAQNQIGIIRQYVESLNLSYPSQELRGEVVIVIQENEVDLSIKDKLEQFIFKNELTNLHIKQLTHNRLSISVRGINKRSAIEGLSDDDLKQTVFFCDEQNDLELTKLIKEKGGQIVCPSNAIDEIKAIANFVSDLPHSYGIVDYFSKVAKNS